MNDFKQKIEDELARQKAELLKPNIVVVGGTGVGKSSLVNRFFGIEVASADAGRPVTKGMDRYEQDDIPVVIYDTEGYEITSSSDEGNNFDENIKPKIENMNSKELKEQIHLVWYCISITNHRVTSYDLQNIEYFLSNGMKTSVVFTKCDCDEELLNGNGKEASEFKKIIQDKFPNIEFFETSINKDLTLDLDKINDWSSESLSDDRLKASFISAQKVSIEMKKQEARKYVNSISYTNSILAGLSAAASISKFSDSLIINNQQIKMCIKISTIFGFDSFGAKTQSVIESKLMAISGKKIASNLIKLLNEIAIVSEKNKEYPFISKIITGVINASIAGVMTYALGIALIEVYAKAYSDYLEKGELPNWMELFSSDEFVNHFLNAFEKYQGLKNG